MIYFLMPDINIYLQGAFTQINCSSPLYIGGVPEYEKTKRTAAVLKPFTGVIQKVWPFFNTAANKV